jgi:hypothetical protein
MRNVKGNVVGKLTGTQDMRENGARFKTVCAVWRGKGIDKRVTIV